MLTVSLDKVKQYTDIPGHAERLLAKSEKEITFNLTLLVDETEMLEASTYVVYANTSRGPAKGGIRIAPDVTLEETRDLAERMVLKTALIGIPFGGGKSGICLDSKTLTRFQRIAVIKEFVHVMSLDLLSGTYIPAPDLGTDANDMATIYGETHVLESVTGKPPRVGGLPGRKEATGRGVAHAAESALENISGRETSGATIAVQGFGNVGSWTCFFLHHRGAKIVAVSDEYGGVFNKKGLDIDALMKHVSEGKNVQDFGGDKISNDELLAMKVDVLIPAAVENQLTAENAADVEASLIVEGANGPTTKEADKMLEESGVVIIPDILANCGGVVGSYVEWRKAKSGSMTDSNETYATITERIDLAFDKVVRLAKEKGISSRLSAEVIAVSEVVDTMRDRGWF